MKCHFCSKKAIHVCDECGKGYCQDHGHYEYGDPVSDAFNGDCGDESFCYACIDKMNNAGNRKEEA
jgi:hypothetical protein